MNAFFSNEDGTSGISPFRGFDRHVDPSMSTLSLTEGRSCLTNLPFFGRTWHGLDTSWDDNGDGCDASDE